MSDFKKRIEEGLSGDYQGLKNGFNRLNEYIYGLQRGYYYLIGGLSGASKTTLTDFMLLNAIRDADEKGIECNVIYYSYEIDQVTKKANWMANHIYNKYRKIISPQVIAGLGENRMTKEEQKLVFAEVDYIENLFKRIHFRYDSVHPTAIYMELFKFAESKGEFIYEEYEGGKKIKSYEPKNPNAYNIVVMDHLFLCKSEKGMTAKDTIDKYSTYCIWMRNMVKYTFLSIQQFNQSLNSVDRQKYKGIDISPQQSDFRDSTSPYADSDLAIGIVNSWKMDLKETMGYDLTLIKEKFRQIKVIKNRRGRDNISIGVVFDPRSGMFFELPPASQMTQEIYDKINLM